MTAHPRDQPQSKAAQEVSRPPKPCMCCGKPFASQGIHNRLCGFCRTHAFSGAGLITSFRGKKGEGTMA